MPRVKRLFTLTSLWLFVSSIGPAWAQSDRGTITGTVTDPSGAVISGASVTASNTATGFRTTTVTSASGNYTIPLLPVGIYDVTVEASGFKKYVQPGITVDLGQTVSLDIRMQVGARTETVEVTPRRFSFRKTRPVAGL